MGRVANDTPARKRERRGKWAAKEGPLRKLKIPVPHERIPPQEKTRPHPHQEEYPHNRPLKDSSERHPETEAGFFGFDAPCRNGFDPARNGRGLRRRHGRGCAHGQSTPTNRHRSRIAKPPQPGLTRQWRGKSQPKWRIECSYPCDSIPHRTPARQEKQSRPPAENA